MATNITSGWLRTQSVVAMNRLDIYIHRALDRPIPDDNSHPLDVKKYIRETEKDITTAKNSIDRIWELHGHWNNLIDSTSKANRAQEEACRDELFGPAGKPNIEARTIAVEDSLAELESRVADAKDLQNQLTTKPLIIAQEQPTIPASAPPKAIRQLNIAPDSSQQAFTSKTPAATDAAHADDNPHPAPPTAISLFNIAPDSHQRALSPGATDNAHINEHTVQIAPPGEVKAEEPSRHHDNDSIRTGWDTHVEHQPDAINTTHFNQQAVHIAPLAEVKAEELPCHHDHGAICIHLGSHHHHKFKQTAISVPPGFHYSLSPPPGFDQPPKVPKKIWNASLARAAPPPAMKTRTRHPTTTTKRLRPKKTRRKGKHTSQLLVDDYNRPMPWKSIFRRHFKFRRPEDRSRDANGSENTVSRSADATPLSDHSEEPDDPREQQAASDV